MLPSISRGVLLSALFTAIAAANAQAVGPWLRPLTPSGTAPQGVMYTRGVWDALNQRFVITYGTTDGFCATSQDFLWSIDYSQDRRGEWKRINAGTALGYVGLFGLVGTAAKIAFDLLSSK